MSNEKPPEDAENGRNLYTNISVEGNPEIPPIPEPTCTARWRLPASQSSGNYAIYVHIPRPAQFTGTNMPIDSAVYRIRAGASTSEDIIINQYQISADVLSAEIGSPDATVESGWIYIGKYDFAQEDENYVELTNLKYGPSLWREVISWTPYEETWHAAEAPIIMADAVKFVPTTTGNTPTPTATSTPLPTSTATFTPLPTSTPLPAAGTLTCYSDNPSVFDCVQIDPYTVRWNIIGNPSTAPNITGQFEVQYPNQQVYVTAHWDEPSWVSIHGWQTNPEGRYGIIGLPSVYVNDGGYGTPCSFNPDKLCGSFAVGTWNFAGE